MEQKTPEDLGSSGARTSVRRRPGYSSSGCTPAEPDSASPGGSLITSFTEERYANDLKEGRTVRSVPAPNCGNQGTSVTSVLQAIDGCGTLDPDMHAYATVAQPDRDRLIARAHGNPADAKL